MSRARTHILNWLCSSVLHLSFSKHIASTSQTVCLPYRRLIYTFVHVVLSPSGRETAKVRAVLRALGLPGPRLPRAPRDGRGEGIWHWRRATGRSRHTRVQRPLQRLAPPASRSPQLRALPTPAAIHRPCLLRAEAVQGGGLLFIAQLPVAAHAPLHVGRQWGGAGAGGGVCGWGGPSASACLY